MAHDLEIVNGKASFFSVMLTAWHGLGKVLTEAPRTIGEALELCAQDFNVVVRPNTFSAYTQDGDSFQKESTLSATIVREDTNAELGTASPTYHPMQNEDAFRPFAPLLDNGFGTIETGGGLRGGVDSFLMVRWNLDKFSGKVQDAFGGTDKIVPFALITNSHSGRRGIEMLHTDVRVVCRNTLTMARSGATNKVTIKHSAQANTRLVEAAQEMWGGLLMRYEILAQDFETLRALTLTEAQFRAAVLDVIAPLPQEAKDFDQKGKFAAVVVARAEEKRTELVRLWDKGDGHTGNRSGWEAVQGAVQALDHSEQFFRGRSLDARAVALMDGPLAAMKGKVYANVLALAGSAK